MILGILARTCARFAEPLAQAREFALKARIRKDRLKRKVFAEYEEERLRLRETARNRDADAQTRLQAQLRLHALPSHSRPISIRNRCVVTGRARGVIKEFRISRILMREWAHRGMLPGVKKASW